MNPASSLLAKILSWFFLNMVLVAVALALFFAFQSHLDLHAIFGQQATNRLMSAGTLIAQDLNKTSRENWPDVLSRHAAIHRVDFALVLRDGSHLSSSDGNLPAAVMARAIKAIGPAPPGSRFPPPRRPGHPPHSPQNPPFDTDNSIIGNPPPLPEAEETRPSLRMRTRNPSRYWSGILVHVAAKPSHPPLAVVLLAVSDSVTGSGFFFDPLPWVVAAAAVLLISMLLWLPMVRNITQPLGRMTRATEEIAKGRFDVSIHEERSDEIGRLSMSINRMTSRLSALVTGQKRFLGDVAHELGSPIARIQFGLGALGQRISKENQQRVIDVMEDVDHMADLVNELLAFSRADMKSDTVTLEEIDLLPIVETAVKREATPVADISVRVDPGIRVYASAELLTRALANLVRNAVKYAGGDGPVKVAAEKRKDSVDIVVRDNGPGVPEDLLDQLFEPFFRPEASRGRDSGGVGLGLAIVKTCVETCRGAVSADNIEPRGFAVTITLPA